VPDTNTAADYSKKYGNAPAFWYSRNLPALLLWPLSLLFQMLIWLRRQGYRRGWLTSYRLAVPVIVVGNIVVGGSGKTPLLTRLAELLRDAGYNPGIISRGYGAQSDHWPRRVVPDSDALAVGDEPVLLARRCGCPVVVDPDRVTAAQTLLRTYDCDVLLSDDGLQHYRLDRDIEIAVIDSAGYPGNGFCLPAGPLREPPQRLESVDFIVRHQTRSPYYGDLTTRRVSYNMILLATYAVNLHDPASTRLLSSFTDAAVHAVAGIAHPGRFFNMLMQMGIDVIPHAFPDHHRFTGKDLLFADEKPVLMTEKDAVKCSGLIDSRYWYVPVQTQLDSEFEQLLLARLKSLYDRRPRDPKLVSMNIGGNTDG
jgi:tetraacyldisaccharide 4'-kinase